jgi:hypothetical protein
LIETVLSAPSRGAAIRGALVQGTEAIRGKAQARRELERVYAEDPGFEDVRERLGLGGGVTTTKA